MIRCAVVPPLTIVVTAYTGWPTGTGPTSVPSLSDSSRDSRDAVAYSPARVASAMSGMLTGTRPARVKDSAPLVPPGAVGANVTGARSVSPRCRVTGKVTGTRRCAAGEVSVTRPTVNGSGEVTAEDTERRSP